MRTIYTLVIIILSILLIVLQVNFWAGKGSWQEVRQLDQQILQQQLENKKLIERNRALVAEVKDLKGGLESYDERARLEFGMIHKDETFFQIVKPE